MKVLWLGPLRGGIEECLHHHDDEFERLEEPLHAGHPALLSADFLLSYGYRHIIPEAVLEPFGVRAVNLHIAYLPWNRGADPNLWSFLEDTPKGVTIHLLDAGIDTGPILMQREIVVLEGDTLRTTYDRLSHTIEELFCESWPALRAGAITPISQEHDEGSMHLSADKTRYEQLLVEGWDTPVDKLVGRALRGRG